jgi:16S rRNA (adenine1518-N6/adenine1519-N6)-dimethyltransferase
LRQLLDVRDVLEDWSVMIQSEVAGRLSAATGERAYGSLTVLHRLAADVDQVAAVGPDRFFPRPKVESSFVRVWPRANSPLREGELAAVERLTRAAFGQRRKRVTNGLARIAERTWSELDRVGQREALEAQLRAVDIDPGLRPERIEPEAWLALARAMPRGGRDAGPETTAAPGGRGQAP